MRFNGQVRSIAVKPTKDASQIEVRIVAEARRGITEGLVRLLMAEVAVELTEEQLQLAGEDEAAQ